MSSGCYTGYQHQLMDMENLDKEKFIKFCDEAFYNLDRFGISVEDAKNCKRTVENLQRYKDDLDKYNKELEAKKNSDVNKDELRLKYLEYVTKRKEDNEGYLQTYIKEWTKYNQIMEYVKHFKGRVLDYIWDNFEEPKLFEMPILSFEEFVQGELDTSWLERRVERTKEDIIETEKRLEESRVIIDNYEKLKESF